MSEDLRDKFGFWPPFGAETIRKIIPHRYPFLHVDQMTTFYEDGMEGYKLLSSGEPCFQGHFPDQPIFPGVLQIETAAQVGACWILSLRENLGKIAYLMSVEEAKFRRPAIPGMRLDVKGRIRNLKSRTGRLQAEVTSDGQLISNVTLLFAFQKEDNGAGRVE